jgi:molybdenum cofactor cytidylyltransferase
VVLAAGRSTRMGTQKVLLPLGGKPLVQWVVDAALGSRAVQTIVVVGHAAAAVVDALGDQPVRLVVNSAYEAGMSASLGAGLKAVDPACAGALVLLGDQPFVTASLLDALIARFAETSTAVVRPVVDGRAANPVLIPRTLFAEILEQRGDVGGREVVARHAGEVCLVTVSDPRTVVDIDSPEDYEAAQGRV